MAGRIWLDAVLGLGPEWKVTRVEPARKPKELRVELKRGGNAAIAIPPASAAIGAIVSGIVAALYAWHRDRKEYREAPSTA